MSNFTMNNTESLGVTDEITNEPSFTEQTMAHWMFKAGIQIDKWWFLILVPFGFIGNCLSLAVMAMKHNRRLSTCTYLMAINTNDNICLILFIIQWLVTNTDLITVTDLVCKIHGSLIIIFVYNGSYQVILMTIDKCLAIRFPHKASLFCTPKRAKIALLLSFVFLVIFNSPHFYLTRLVVLDCAGYAVKHPLVEAYVYLSFIVASLIPFVSLIVMNCLIIRAVRKSRKMHLSSCSNLGPRNSVSEANDKVHNNSQVMKMKQVETQLTRMLVLIATVHVILFLPSYIRFVYSQIVDVRGSPDVYAGFFFFVHLSFKLYATNSGINFFVYLFSGLKFRNDLKILLRIKPKSKDIDCSMESKVTSQTNVSVISTNQAI